MENNITQSLASCFATGFAVQQAVEIVSSCLALKDGWETNVQSKKAVLSLVALGLSTTFVWSLDLDVLQPFLNSSNSSGFQQFVHRIVTAVFISAGTEGFNSILKWLSYKKEDAKASAADKKFTAGQSDGNANAQTALKMLPS